jgi:hypothetical protein
MFLQFAEIRCTIKPERKKPDNLKRKTSRTDNKEEQLTNTVKLLEAQRVS